MDKALISAEFERELSIHGTDVLISDMHHVLRMETSCLVRREFLHDDLRFAESSGTFNANVFKVFKDWFNKTDSSGIHDYEEFKTLIGYRDFMLLSFYLCRGLAYFDPLPSGLFTSLRSSDKVVLKIDKSAAAAESMVLDELIDLTGGQGEILVPLVSSDVLRAVIDFCEKKHELDNILTSLMGRYEGWLIGFLKANQSILYDLHQVSQLCHISCLLCIVIV